MHGNTIDDDLATARTIRARSDYGEQHVFIPDEPPMIAMPRQGTARAAVVLRNFNDILSVYQIHGGAQLLRVDGDNWPDSVA